MKKHILFQGVLGTVLTVLAVSDVNSMLKARLAAGAGQTQVAANVLAQHTNATVAEAGQIGVSEQQLVQGVINHAGPSGAGAVEQIRNRGMDPVNHAGILSPLQKVEAVFHTPGMRAGNVWRIASDVHTYNVSIEEFISAIFHIYERTGAYPLGIGARDTHAALNDYGLADAAILGYLRGAIAGPHHHAGAHDEKREMGTKFKQEGMPVGLVLQALDDALNGGRGAAAAIGAIHAGLIQEALHYGYDAAHIFEGLKEWFYVGGAGFDDAAANAVWALLQPAPLNVTPDAFIRMLSRAYDHSFSAVYTAVEGCVAGHGHITLTNLLEEMEAAYARDHEGEQSVYAYAVAHVMRNIQFFPVLYAKHDRALNGMWADAKRLGMPMTSFVSAVQAGNRNNYRPAGVGGAPVAHLGIALHSYGVFADRADLLSAIEAIHAIAGLNPYAEIVTNSGAGITPEQFAAAIETKVGHDPVHLHQKAVADYGMPDDIFLNDVMRARHGVGSAAGNDGAHHKAIAHGIGAPAALATYIAGRGWTDAEANGMKLPEFVHEVNALGGGFGGGHATLGEALAAYNVPVGTVAECQAFIKAVAAAVPAAQVFTVGSKANMSRVRFVEAVIENLPVANRSTKEIYAAACTHYRMHHVGFVRGLAEAGKIDNTWGDLKELRVTPLQYVNGLEFAGFNKNLGVIPQPASIETWHNAIRGGMSAIEFVQGIEALEVAQNAANQQIFVRALLDGMDKDIFAATVYVLYQEEQEADIAAGKVGAALIDIGAGQPGEAALKGVLLNKYKMVRRNVGNWRDDALAWLQRLNDTEGKAIDFTGAPVIAAMKMAQALAPSARLVNTAVANHDLKNTDLNSILPALVAKFGPNIPLPTAANLQGPALHDQGNLDTDIPLLAVKRPVKYPQQ